MKKELEKWLQQSANEIVKEFTDNTVSGLIGLQEFAKYAGNSNPEELMYGIMKRVAEHTQHVCKTSG